ncbi:DUF917 domain-containing protein [Ketobacter alkanivorans]|uniref:DUF917 domain-containing protein n=1 Tax=Ketobacter alkanivorans TaxID=1917421 RepID=A0A2K9LID3_9GAMM|nr:DUF917 family protein [Ketobacter alkanivorans]AUM12000.1 hypothetical protein Kalk_06000 [Ketobacter alkanivorans]
MYKINKSDMQVIVNGASFLASGGGGGVASANAVIDNIMSFATEVEVVESSEVQDSDQLLVVCGVGAPDAPNLDFKNSPGYALTGLQTMTGDQFQYVLPIEVGAMNSMIPLLACAQYSIPMLDGDGAGRSVPQMSMCTYALQGFPVNETLVVSEEDEQFPLHPANATQLEAQVRQVVSTQLQDAGTVGTWPVTGAQINSPDAFVPGSLSLAKEIGTAMTAADPLSAVQAIIEGYYSDNLIIMSKGTVSAATNKVEDGFDVGTITVNDDTGMSVTLYFVNESLLATVDIDGQPATFMMGPDMICSMGVDGSPMTNSEICSQFASGETVQISLMWVQAVDAIRTPLMFFKYLELLLEKFGQPNLGGYRFIEDAKTLFK